MAHPLDAYGGGGLQLWKAAANILNKKSQLIKGGPPAWGLGGLRTPHHIKVCYEMLYMALVACSCENGNESFGSIQGGKFD
jgi:hypothetical protein